MSEGTSGSLSASLLKASLVMMSDKVVQGFIQSGLKHLQGGRLYNLSVLLLPHSIRNYFVAIYASYISTSYHISLGSTWLCLLTCTKVPCKLGPLQIHFSRLKKSQFFQPVLKGQTLNLVTVERQICLALEAQITPRALDTIQRVPTRAG